MEKNVFGLFSLMFVLVLMVSVLKIAAYKAASDRLEDSLAASGLAASLIDIRQYGTDHSIIISDMEDAFAKYRETLEINLGLTNGVASGSSYIEGPVSIDVFRIYNVSGPLVTETAVSDEGVRQISEGVLGEMKAPNGQIVEKTGIYSEISFLLKSSLGKNIRAHKSKLTFVDTV